VANNGTLAFNRSDTVLFDGVISGLGGVNQDGSGTTILGGPNTYSGSTNVNAGILQAGGENTLSANSAFKVAPQGTLDLDGHSQTIAGLDNAGWVYMHMVPGGAGAIPGTTLTVTGAYISNGGNLVFNTDLGDSSSPTDLLKVGSAVLGRGATKVFVSPANPSLGGLTTGNGIELIQIARGGQSDAGAFTQGARIAAGAYDYTFYRAGDGNWYLRSGGSDNRDNGSDGGSGGNTDGAAVAPRGEIQAAMAAQALAGHFGLTMLGTYHERTGGDTCLQKPSADGRCNGPVWARAIGAFGAFRNGGRFTGRGASYDFSLGGIQTGIDLVRGPSDSAGLYAGFGSAGGTVRDLRGASGGITTGRIGFNGYALGAYWTHHGTSGWYTDAVFQQTWYDSVASSMMGGVGAQTQGSDTIASVEAGVPVALGEGVAFEPQAQLVYQHLHLNDTADAYGRYHYRDLDAVHGRLGGRLFKIWAEGTPVTAWATANVWHTFAGMPQTTVTTLAGTQARTFTGSPTLGQTWGQFGLGVSADVAKNVTLFATANYNANFDATSGYSLDGRLGLRVKW
jgi:outer membrane autotransporter protein